MDRKASPRFIVLLTLLLLVAAAGTALADPAEGRPDRGERSGDVWRGSGRQDERRATPPERRWDRDRRDERNGDRDAWRYRDEGRVWNAPRYERDRRYGRDYNTPRRDYDYGHRGYDYGYRDYGYRGYDYGHGYGYPRRWQRDDNGDDVAFTIAGGVLGGIIGNHVTTPENRAAGTVFGAIIGGVLGHAIGQSNNDDHDRGSRRYPDERRYPR